MVGVKCKMMDVETEAATAARNDWRHGTTTANPYHEVSMWHDAWKEYYGSAFDAYKANEQAKMYSNDDVPSADGFYTNQEWVD